jgi:threonine/homoserine/homoserine lactone efflux protein
VWLGLQAWRAPVADFAPAAASPRETTSRWSLFRGGFLVGVSNPKLLVFAAAFFPQFIAPDAPWAPQFLLLVVTFVAVEACTYFTLGLSARGLSRYLVQAVWQRRINRVSGAIFAGFGCALLRYRP